MRSYLNLLTKILSGGGTDYEKKIFTAADGYDLFVSVNHCIELGTN
jgi:hypothetical protein